MLAATSLAAEQCLAGKHEWAHVGHMLAAGGAPELIPVRVCSSGPRLLTGCHTRSQDRAAIPLLAEHQKCPGTPAPAAVISGILNESKVKSGAVLPDKPLRICWSVWLQTSAGDRLVREGSCRTGRGEKAKKKHYRDTGVTEASEAEQTARRAALSLGPQLAWSSSSLCPGLACSGSEDSVVGQAQVTGLLELSRRREGLQCCSGK